MNQLDWSELTRRERMARSHRGPIVSAYMKAVRLDQLKTVLRRGAGAAGYATELWTLQRISQVIRKRFGVRYSPVGVWAVLRHGLGWSWQKPERRALQRDEAAIAQWRGRRNGPG